MSGPEPSKEPKPTPWPKKQRPTRSEAWPPELDETTWKSKEAEVQHEE